MDIELDWPIGLIETLEDLEQFAGDLANCKRVSVDVEADSFYSYHPKVCLLQISTDQEDVVIDPLVVKDMSPLGPLFRNPRIEKVFHAAEYDLQCLKRDYGFEIHGLFDTMAAARLLGAKQLGLAPLILKYFEVSLSKKLQRADWGKRPLSAAQIEYARLDTHYLLPLKDKLHHELEIRNLLKDAVEEFARLENIEPAERMFDPDTFWRLHGVRLLSPRSRAVLKELYFFREQTAASLDKAPFRVLPESLLVRLAELLPHDLRSLEKVSGMTSYLFRRFGQDLVDVIANGLDKPPIESPPERKRPASWDTATLHRYQALRQWRKKRAEERGVDPVVILATEDIRRLAAAPSESPNPAAWLSNLTERKRELYGTELAEILKAPPPVAVRKRRGRRHSLS